MAMFKTLASCASSFVILSEVKKKSIGTIAFYVPWKKSASVRLIEGLTLRALESL